MPLQERIGEPVPPAEVFFSAGAVDPDLSKETLKAIVSEKRRSWQVMAERESRDSERSKNWNKNETSERKAMTRAYTIDVVESQPTLISTAFVNGNVSNVSSVNHVSKVENVNDVSNTNSFNNANNVSNVDSVNHVKSDPIMNFNNDHFSDVKNDDVAKVNNGDVSNDVNVGNDRVNGMNKDGVDGSDFQVNGVDHVDVKVNNIDVNQVNKGDANHLNSDDVNNDNLIMKNGDVNSVDNDDVSISDIAEANIVRNDNVRSSDGTGVSRKITAHKHDDNVRYCSYNMSCIFSNVQYIQQCHCIMAWVSYFTMVILSMF